MKTQKKYWFFYSDLNNLCRKSVEREKCFKKYEFSKNRLRNLIGLKKIEKTEKGLQLQKNNNNIKWEVKKRRGELLKIPTRRKLI